MTFTLSSEHQAVRDRARAWAETLQARAAAIDLDAAIPSDVLEAGAAIAPQDNALGLTIAVEEMARASAAAAVAIGAGTSRTESVRLTGLRGAPVPENTPRSQLVLAATAAGVGGAALQAALAELRRASAEGSGDVEKPHWVVADAATELDAARLLIYKAARSLAEGDIALARLMANGAATRAVEAAVRVVGADALVEGSLLERLARDARALTVLLGTEEQHRAVAAGALLPA